MAKRVKRRIGLTMQKYFASLLVPYNLCKILLISHFGQKIKFKFIWKTNFSVLNVGLSAPSQLCLEDDLSPTIVRKHIFF